VDKKIEATLTKAEQPATARSRKASHYLRVFKENDAAEEKKRREGRAKDRPDERGTEKSYSKSRPSSLIHSPEDGPGDSYFDVISAPTNERGKERTAADLENSGLSPGTSYKREFPLQLLEQIRSIGNLALHGRQTDSAAGRQRPSETTSPPSRTDYFQAVEDARRTQTSGSDDDESEKEQISSALYFPHRQLQSPAQTPGEEERRKPDAERIRIATPVRAGTLPKGWSKEEAVKTPGEVEISLQSQDTNQCLHGDMPPTHPLPQEEEKHLPSSPELTASAGSEYDSVPDSSYSIAGDESSATDDLGTTPTATPRKKETRPPLAPQPPAPLGAVELKPYDHQVGGHTTVYRFSRRAVCKQLNNRENEFYETVERHHPELLEFLPRYDIFLSLFSSVLKLKPQRRQIRPPSLVC
jgi:hypothetical protein